MEENKEEILNQEGGQVSYTKYYLTSDSQVQYGAATKTLTQINNLANQYHLAIGSSLESYPSISLADGTSINNKILLLSDLLGLLDSSSDIYKLFNTLPIAQFKHLPDPAALNPVNLAPATSGGGNGEDINNAQYEEKTVKEEEEFPSLEVQDEPQTNITTPTQGGSKMSHKWSSHKKRKSARYSTKKNKKL